MIRSFANRIFQPRSTNRPSSAASSAPSTTVTAPTAGPARRLSSSSAAEPLAVGRSYHDGGLQSALASDEAEGPPVGDYVYSNSKSERMFFSNRI